MEIVYFDHSNKRNLRLALLPINLLYFIFKTTSEKLSNQLFSECFSSLCKESLQVKNLTHKHDQNL